MRVLFIIQYDGTAYAGFQAQKNAIAVQNKLEHAINRVTGEGNKLVAAGRTDERVHAIGQAAHFDTNKTYPPERFRQAVNAYLPRDIYITAACAVSDDFHARYSTSGKTYLYKCNVSPHYNPLKRNTHMHVREPLNIDAMRKAAEKLLGQHDFAAFCKTGGSNKTTVRTITEIKINTHKDPILFKNPESETESHNQTISNAPKNPESESPTQVIANDYELHVYVSGNGFLYNMVRIIMGVLLNVAKGNLQPDDIPKILDSKSREFTRQVAEPQGLYLLRVDYQ